MDHEIGRRDLIKITAGAAIASTVQAAAQAKFLTPDEHRLVDELTEMIIPADNQSGGAKAAGVAGYIDTRLAEAFENSEREEWRKGLAGVNAIAREMHGSEFLKCDAAQRLAVLTRMAANEGDPKKPEEHFFVSLKEMTVHGYYTSKVGIHDDMKYVGNTYQQGDYAGELPEPHPK